jgi:Excalibur calcium-binding domain
MMMKLFSLTLGLTNFLIASPDAAAQVFKCEVNGAVHYQQVPCQSSQARKPPTVEALNAERQKQLEQVKERSPNPKVLARPVASPESLERVAEQVHALPSSTFKCDSRKYCTQMASCAEAKYFLSNCPGVKMDGDGDGIPCEEQLCGH